MQTHHTHASGASPHHAHHHSLPQTTTHATIHCLIGCSIGEFTGLAIGIALGFSLFWIIVLDTTLALIVGMTLATLPVMKQMNRKFFEAIKIIWLGEVVSITVMEIAMNWVDYEVGGMQSSLTDPMFYVAIPIAMLAGFVVAWPVNWWMLKKNIKTHH